MRNDHWILDENKRVVGPVELLVWARWFEESPNRIVKQEWIGDTRVSTVFLGLDHNFGDGPPVLWETMCFSNRADLQNYMYRCSGNWEQAEAMHERMCLHVCEIEGVNLTTARNETDQHT